MNQKQDQRASYNDRQGDAIHSAHEVDQLAPATAKYITHVTDDCDQQTAPAKLNSRKVGKDIRKAPANIPAKMRKPVMNRDDEDCPWAVLEKHLPGIVVLLRKPRETLQKTIDDGSARRAGRGRSHHCRPTVAPAIAISIAGKMRILPWLARKPANRSTVSPGMGMPMFSDITPKKTTQYP